ncbi:hypothetical protein RHGRI_006492 [Rhododendron griersonianum]|uniref:Disease resistance protein RGA3 n=1 Tax=Rhododendron griersonianum TaxID=479676 RepID=A0AAV6KTV5_9ERIC|nr:hypothetical protein RHGRI_006492 [Rhododendron griersonianum]
MAETILVDIAGHVLSSLGSYAIQHIGLPFGVKGELRKMENNISTIKNVLLDAQEKQMSNRAVKEWLERLKIILYDAEDLLDEVATETKRRQVESLMRKVHYFFTGSNPLVFRYVVSCKIRDIGKRLDEIVLQMNAFKFVVKLVERPIQINRREETISFVNPVTVIGRDADKEKLVRLLLSSGDEENVAIIPIVGMGGLGKTTFAQLVYNDDRIHKHFTKRLWVCISGDFDVRRILIKLLQAGYPDRDTSYSNKGLEQLQNRVRNLLREDKFILFLDDVWNEDRVEWKKLEDLLITQAKGSRIVVTTRSKMVASIVRTSTVEPYELRENIGKLKLLRYIDAPANLPNSLCMLLNLQYLDLCQSHVYGLPEDLWKLISLRFLGLTTTLARLPKEGIGRLTSLRMLFFYKCFNLESLGEGIEYLSCLRDLALWNCSKLVSLPAGFRDLTSLERLEIGSCKSLNLSEDDDFKGLRSLKRLGLRHLPGLVNLPNGLLDAAATLTRFDIEFCRNFTSPSESILPNLLSLQSLAIVDCRKVASLPEGMQRLTKLQDLFISRCRLNTTIRYREGGEDWPKIAHVPNIKIDG